MLKHDNLLIMLIDDRSWLFTYLRDMHAVQLSNYHIARIARRTRSGICAELEVEKSSEEKPGLASPMHVTFAFHRHILEITRVQCWIHLNRNNRSLIWLHSDTYTGPQSEMMWHGTDKIQALRLNTSQPEQLRPVPILPSSILPQYLCLPYTSDSYTFLVFFQNQQVYAVPP